MAKRCAITITFGEVAENGVGMEEIGEKALHGLTVNELNTLKRFFKELGYKCELVYLNDALPAGLSAEKAWVLIVRQGANVLCGERVDELMEVLKSLEWDKKSFTRYKKVCNKLMRWNMIVADFEQEPQYELGKGRVYNFENIEILKTIRTRLGKILGPKCENLFAEGNYYHDLSKKVGIGYHGDTERKIVIAIRLGESMALTFRWYHQHRCVSDIFEFRLNHGDMYFMSEKAVGGDWKKSSIPTLRHAAGVPKVVFPEKEKCKKVKISPKRKRSDKDEEDEKFRDGKRCK